MRLPAELGERNTRRRLQEVVKATDGWRPKPGSRVRLRPRPKAAPDEPAPPVGVWSVVDRGPAHLSWWVQPIDLEARAWASQHTGSTVSGCWLAHDQQLDPINAVRLF
jgi:hypothetical protein